MGTPACLPNFAQLCREIAKGTGKEPQNGEFPDRFLGMLRHDGVEVHELAKGVLEKRCPKPTDLHHNLLGIFPSEATTRIVTTNFDLLFEQASEMREGTSNPDVFRAPALPLGSSFSGIVHVHGALDRPKGMVLTDADFGRAYLTEGWARRFLIGLFQSFTVLFVGYSHSDVVMTYLARALPAGTGNRFVLTDKAEDGVWERLGITSIRFPDSDFDVLCGYIRKLADYATRGVLDWQHLIAELAQKPPSQDDESTGLLDDVLADEVHTRFFTAKARDPAWITWLDERKHIDGLFYEHNQLDGPRRHLAHWLVEVFALDDPNEVWLLIGRHGMNVNSELWHALARKVASSRRPALEKETVARWVSFLLATAPSAAGDLELQYLSDRCIESQAWGSLVDIFEVVTAFGLRVSRFPYELYSDMNSPNAPKVHAELEPARDDYRYVAQHIWENGLKPNLRELTDDRLVAVVLANLEAQHRTLCAWGSGSRAWDPLSYQRHSIGLQTHAHPKIEDIVIDAARDCLVWTALHDLRAADRWCDRLGSADAPVLRRLAIHNVTSRRDLPHDTVIDWLLKHGTLYDWSAQEEVLRGLCAAYPHASSDRRSAVIKTILDYRWPDSEDEDRDRQTLKYHFSWLEWIVDAAPGCGLANHALEDLKSRFPTFNVRISPRLHHPPAVVDRLTPRRAQDLLAQSPSQCIDGLLTFEPNDRVGPNRVDVLRVVRDAASQNYDWAMGIVDELIQRKAWNSDLWTTVILSLSVNELDDERCRRVLQVLDRSELYRSQAKLVASVLEAMSRNLAVRRTDDVTNHADSIATAMWSYLDDEHVPQQYESYWMEATSRAGGILAVYWLNRFARNQSSECLGGIENRREVLSAFIRDPTTAGRFGRSVLARRFSVLLATDEAWTKEQFVPRLLDYSDRDEYEAIWHGFLCGSIDTQVAEVTCGAFLCAVEQIDSVFSHGFIRERFIRVYMTMSAFYADDPLETWIPRLFRYATEDDRQLFIREIEEWLENMSDAQRMDLWKRWLRKYWDSRVDGIPDGLKPRETGEMLRWLPSLHRAFDDAAGIAIRMPKNADTHYDVTAQISKTALPEACSDSVARLLIYLGECGKYHGWFKGSELVDRVLRCGVAQDLKVGVKELVARQGW